MNLQLENKLVLVNGSTAGIGSAIDKALVAEAVRVTVNGRNEASLPFSATVMKRASKNLMKLSSNSKNNEETVTKRIWQGQERQRRTSIKLGIHSPGIRQLT